MDDSISVDPFFGWSEQDVKPLASKQLVPCAFKRGERQWLLDRIEALKKKVDDADVVVISDDDEQDTVGEHFSPSAHSTDKKESNA